MRILKKAIYYKEISELMASQGHLSVKSQVLEMVFLLIFRGVGPGYYLSAGLWDKNITWKQKLGWRSQSDYRKRVYLYNPRPYQKISQNKVSEKALLSLFKIPTAEFYGFMHPVYGKDHKGHALRNGHDALRVIEENNIDKFCIKELEGFSGRGFKALQVIRLEDGSLKIRPLNKDESFNLLDYFDSLNFPKDGLFFESYIEQHPVMAGLNRSSLNTIRVFVVWHHGEKIPKILGAFVRIGRDGSLVDNTSAGGLAAVIDLQSGQLKLAHYKPPHPERFTEHPDHGAKIKGEVIPFWDEVKNLLVEIMPVFPCTRFCGFDVAITVDGPKIVELNVEPDKTGLMQIGVPIDYALPKFKKSGY